MKTAEQHNAETFDLGQLVQSMAASHAQAVSVGMEAAEARFLPAIRALEREFFAALLDPETKMRTSLQVAITHVLALVPSPITEKVNAYANSKVKQDQLARHEGRPDHDTDVVGRALKAGM